MNQALSSDPDVAEELEDCTIEEPGKDEKAIKTGWPEVQKDQAPSAALVPASRCLDRHLKKLDDLLKRFQDDKSEKLTELQGKLGSQFLRFFAKPPCVAIHKYVLSGPSTQVAGEVAVVADGNVCRPRRAAAA